MGNRRIERLVNNGFRNAVVGWCFLALVFASFVKFLMLELFTWAFMSAAVFIVTIIPAIFNNNIKMIVPWEIVLVSAFPVVARLFITDFGVSSFTGYMAVGALSLTVGVELHLFTTVRMTDGFASFFVFVMTLASAGFWALVRWSSDLLLGTSFITSLYHLMVEMVVAMLSGIFAGVLFNMYFRHQTVSKERFSKGVIDV